jgi:hypothetical protein
MPDKQSVASVDFTQTVRCNHSLAAVGALRLCPRAQLAAVISAPRVVNNDVAMTIREDDSPRLATDGHGQWLAV